jgi:hypothetical protein
LMKLSRNLVRLCRPLAFISSTKVRSWRQSRRISTWSRLGPDLGRHPSQVARQLGRRSAVAHGHSP